VLPCGTRNRRFHHDNTNHIFTLAKVVSFQLYQGNHTDSESINSQITEIVLSITESAYRKAFNWLEWMQYCIKYEGYYFEDLIK